MTNLDFTAASQNQSVFRVVRKIVGVGLIAFGCACFLVMDRTDVVLNASNSLPHDAYLMWDEPVLLTRGAIVGAQMPDLLSKTFGDHMLVKYIGGIPGDKIVIDDTGSPCIEGSCYPADPNLAGKMTMLPSGVIPEGHYALFGSTNKSLDSRYEKIGLFELDELVARGVPIPWPEHAGMGK